ncbi:uncharacterized protein [Anabrus simplex]|uniref:uncharacterized protein n=1 Tax=Anabrus simplex TaxID=316456 RepID=UPI0035A2E775
MLIYFLIYFSCYNYGDIHTFDHIFDTSSRNQDVFDTVIKPLVVSAICGYNTTVLAYGQTASGKTHTMSGDETECGVIRLAISYMFETMKQSSGCEFSVRQYIQSKSTNEGDAGCSINCSLLALGTVMSQLNEGQQRYVNFRDSKLTRILQHSLGGNALTVIICTVTPTAVEETRCTLRFASAAKNVKNEPIMNEVFSEKILLKRYARKISKLKAELEANASNYAQEVEVMENELERKNNHIRRLQARKAL